MNNTNNNNNLEEFVEQHREEFDSAIPNLKIWTAIEKNLDLDAQSGRPLKSLRLWHYVRMAAAILFLLTLGGVIGNYIGQGANTLNKPDKELAEIEAFYQQKIEKKYAQLVQFNHEEAVDADLAQIDEVMEELKADMVNQVPGAKEKIINNLIKSYQLKIIILERVLERIDENAPNQNNKDDEQISI